MLTELEQEQLNRIEANQQRIIKMLMGKLKPAEWISKKEAMELLGCAKTKLSELVRAGTIQVNDNPKKGLQLAYSRKTIDKYLSGTGI